MAPWISTTDVLRYLLDTDVLSKRHRANGENIRQWLRTVPDHELAIDDLTIFEIARGIQKKVEAGEDTVAEQLQAAFETIKEGFAGRIISLDTPTAELWGQLAGSDHRQWMDRGHLAIAKANGLILVSCNSADLKGRGVECIDPGRNKLGHWAPDGTPVKASTSPDA